MAIHDYYLRLDPVRKELVDDVIEDLMSRLNGAGVVTPGDDRVEVVVEAVAQYIYMANVS